MMKFAICLLALAACGLPEKTHCTTTSDCLDGDVCRSGICQPSSDDACGPTGTRCDPQASCTETGGGLACTCHAGYAGDGASCADINECDAATSPCAAHAACSNQPASFACACESGFTGDGNSYCVPSRFTKVAAAGAFTCGLAADGGIYCWGNNAQGDLGDGTIVPRARPTQVGTATDWIDVDARVNMACGIRTDHSMWCWGLGTEGQLGDGTATTRYTPTQVVSDKPGVGWKAIAAGRQTVCGLHDDGSVACWGLNRELGANHPFPLPVAGTDTDWTAISVGTVRCGIRGNPGSLYCWGQSNNGELGLGTQTKAIIPTQVGSALWKSVAVGQFNTCGIRSDGALLCWGTNPLTQTALRYGNTPQQVGTATDWEAISLSSTAVVGLRAGGHAYAWGANDRAQLGLPLALEVPDPTPLSGDVTGWSQISSGNVHGCGIANGQLYCWGTVGEGILGNGASTMLLSPARIGGETWTGLAGDALRQCGIRGDGALLCRGYDPTRGVGFGDTEPVWAPTRIGTDTWTSVVGSSSILESIAMCAIRGGAPYCWGDNSSGELGIGNTDDQLRPVAVKLPPGMQWTEIAVGDHSCAISSEGILYCWGANEAGQLGGGVTSDTPTTAPNVPIAGTWLHVGVTRHGLTAAMTCGIKANHTLWCWGQDQPPTTTQHLMPTQVGVDDTWASLSLGATLNNTTNVAGTICAIKANGTLWCWGTALGNGTEDASSVPVQVGGDTDWNTVSVANEICAVKTGGTLWCWANSGLLGNGQPVDYANPFSAATRPTQIGSDTDWRTVTTSGRSCGTKADGAMWCWGFGAAAIPSLVTVPVPVR